MTSKLDHDKNHKMIVDGCMFCQWEVEDMEAETIGISRLNEAEERDELNAQG